MLAKNPDILPTVIPHEIDGSDYHYLRRSKRPDGTIASRTFRTVDLFAGCGGTALGVEEACRSVGIASEIAWAIDFERAACDVFKDNFPAAKIVHGDIRDYLLSLSEIELSKTEQHLRQNVGKVDLLLGGPPCQGHSDLNNYSRRNDEKNSLYSYMARAARVFRPQYVIIENVQGLPHDKSGVLQSTTAELQKLGYSISQGLVDLSTIGVPQARRRHVLLASLRRTSLPSIAELLTPYATDKRSLEWAIGDLRGRASKDGQLVDQPSQPSKDNVKRIEYLFQNSLFDLPNAERPPCHRDKIQSYTSVYGRLHWDRPSQTVTSGFYSMCMGRNVHPDEPRTLTAHEASRLQFFPDYFDFKSAKNRTALAKLIGNAVPMKLSFALVREILLDGAF